MSRYRSETLHLPCGRMAVRNIGMDLASVSKRMPRKTRQLFRDLDVAIKFSVEDSPKNIPKLITLARKSEAREVSSRIYAMAAAASLRMKKYSDAEHCVSKVDKFPSVVSRNIRAQLLAESGKIDEALDVIEGSLNDEQVIFCSSNSSICNETLDLLHKHIQSSENRQKQTARFRIIQQYLTDSGRRTSLSLQDILKSPMSLSQLEYDSDTDDVHISDTVISQAPSFLMKVEK